MLCVFLLLAGTAPALADTHAPPRAELQELGRRFLDKIGTKLKQADLMMAGADKLRLAEAESKTILPDNEPLVLTGYVGQYRLRLSNDFYTIKRQDQLMVSLRDFCSATDLAISVNTDDGKAQGWFIREDQTFELDMNTMEVKILGKTEKVKPEDMENDGTDILVSAPMLEKWFGLDFKYDLSKLAIYITTTQPLPIEERKQRSLISAGYDYDVGAAKLPLQDNPPRIFSKPNVSASVGAGYSKLGRRSEATKSAQWSAAVTNDFAGFSAASYLNGNRESPLSSFRTALTKKDVDSNLLGPLHATQYQLLDVDSVNLPMVGGGGQEQGVSLTNTPLDVTTETETDIRGNALPGWDIELYRNDGLIGILTVEDDGVYEFNDVDLFVGNNDFRIVFYGTQGEVREERRSVFVDPSKMKRNTGYYSASLTRTDTVTWEKEPSNNPSKGDPRLSAKYEYTLGRLGGVSAGAQARSDLGVQHSLGVLGLSTYLYDTYLNSHVAYDTHDGSYGTETTARRNFGGHSALAQTKVNSRGFNPSDPTADALQKYNIRGNLTGRIGQDLPYINTLNYGTNTEYAALYAGGYNFKSSGTVTTRVGSLGVTSGLDFQRDAKSGNPVEDTLEANVNGRGYWHGNGIQVGARYDILPVSQMDTIDAELRRPLTENVSLKTAASHALITNTTEGEIILDWKAKQAIISPRVRANTNDDFFAGVNVFFNVLHEPINNDYIMTRNAMNYTGGMSARVFLDKNGDGLYAEGEELLQDVRVKAIQAHRSAISDEGGIAFMYDLPEHLQTDITVDQASLPDPYYISLFEGVSIRPRAGIVSKVEFPVVVSGEIDGQADVTYFGRRMAAGIMNVSLIAPDGRVEKSVFTATDGYYAISGIRPGVYYLAAYPDKHEHNAYMLPKKLVFTPEGSLYFGTGLALTMGDHVPFRFRSINAAPEGQKRARVITPDDISGQEVQIELGDYHSRLAMAVAWYRLKLHMAAWSQHFDLAVPLTRIAPDTKTARMSLPLRPVVPVGIETAVSMCKKFQHVGFDCAVSVVTRYKDFGKTAETETQKRKI